MPSIKDLPNKLLIRIVSYLPFHTKKAFRLTCRAYEPIPLPFLFRQIRLSRLREDKDAFERIAARPHLRVHVRELVWYELELEAWRAPSPDDVAVDDYDFMEQLMNAATSDYELFWIPRNALNCSRLYIQERPFELLTQISGLKTVISRPIPADRIISYRGRPLPADLWTLNLEPDISGVQQQLLSYVNNVMPLCNTEIDDISQLNENDGAVIIMEKGGMSKFARTMSYHDDYDDYVDYEFQLSEGDGEEGDREGDTEEGDEEEGNTENKKEDEEDEGEGD
ncbi:hypothetical protein DL768_006015 [Monosporascus sp. mg162]|nr:hypothetical protein DL768_006015 [Monosporascus sp. mg162]